MAPGARPRAAQRDAHAGGANRRAAEGRGLRRGGRGGGGDCAAASGATASGAIASDDENGGAQHTGDATARPSASHVGARGREAIRRATYASRRALQPRRRSRAGSPVGEALPRQARDPLRGARDQLRRAGAAGGAARRRARRARRRSREGDRVAYLGQNAPELLDLLFACSRIGAILVPLSARMPAPELEVVLANTEPTALLAEDAFAETGARGRRRAWSLRIIPFARPARAARRRAGAALRSRSRRRARRC